VDGVTDTDAAWEYKHPSPLARKIKGRVAFGRGVEGSPDDSSARVVNP